MKTHLSGNNKRLSVLLVIAAQVSVVSEVLAVEEEQEELGIPYEVVLPDSVIHDAFPNEEFGDNYSQVKADRVQGAEVDESFYPITKVDQYSGGTSDPETLYRELGDKLDTELMVVIEPEQDPANQLPKPTVVAFDGYTGNEVQLTYASKITYPSISTEERIYLLISQPEEINRVRDRAIRQQQKIDRLNNMRQRNRVTLPTTQSSPIEIINVN